MLNKPDFVAPKNRRHLDRHFDRRSVVKAAAGSAAAFALALAAPLEANAATAPAGSTATPAAGAATAATAKTAAATTITTVHGKDFAQSDYCWYLPAVTSLKNVSYIIDPMTSTKAARIPSQSTNGATNPFALLRLGPNNSSTGTQVVIDGLTLTGTVQPKSAANPTKAGHNYHGLKIHWGRKAQVLNSKFVAAAWADYNSPPGETFQIMGLHDVDTYISKVEVDGRTPDGTRVGGSPAGFNHSARPVIEDSYFHHSLVSSLTYSTAGATPSAATATSSPTTRRVRIEHNANTKMAAGYRFTGINHEHVLGTITHELPKIIIDWTEWTAAHMFFGTWLTSAKIIITVNPAEISGGHPNNMGCLTLAIPKLMNGKPNMQKLSDVTVKDNTGKTLKPYVITAAQSKPMPISKTTHFVLNNS
jgi:hypothetical protein